MMIVDVLLIILAFFAAGPMLYGMWAGRQRANGIDMPTAGELLSDLWASVEPYAAALWWIGRKAAAPRRVTEPPPWRAYVTTDEADPVAMLRDEGLSGLSAAPSAPSEPARDIISPGDRAAAIRALVASGWTTGQIRGLLKGDNGVIGQEVEAARAAMGLEAPRRIVTVRDGTNVRKVEL